MQDYSRVGIVSMENRKRDGGPLRENNAGLSGYGQVNSGNRAMTEQRPPASFLPKASSMNPLTYGSASSINTSAASMKPHMTSMLSNSLIDQSGSSQSVPNQKTSFPTINQVSEYMKTSLSQELAFQTPSSWSQNGSRSESKEYFDLQENKPLDAIAAMKNKRSMGKFVDSLPSKPMAIMKKKDSEEPIGNSSIYDGNSPLNSKESLNEEASKHLDHVLTNSPKPERFKYQKKPSVSQSTTQPIPGSPPSKKVSVPMLDSYGVPIDATQQLRKKKNGAAAERIRVCVRKRPLNSREQRKNEQDIAVVLGRRQLAIQEPKVKVDLTKYIEEYSFSFDEVFDTDATNDDVYKRTAQPLVEYVFAGGKATCFAYGQTGSGKTYTMLDSNRGLYVMAARDIFHLLEQPEYQHLSAWVSFYEIYQGQLYDLLNNRQKLYAREDGKQNVCIRGLVEYDVDTVEKLMQIFEAGSLTRSTGATGANSDSSRSHAIFQICLKFKNARNKIRGKFSFIDLAGSERGADRGESDKQTRMEGSEINKSLLALKECIRALDQVSKHLPFRQSKLTQTFKEENWAYLARVKELKGDVDYNDEEFSKTEDAMEDEDSALSEDEDGRDDILDAEFPPENFSVTSEGDDLTDQQPPKLLTQMSDDALYSGNSSGPEESKSRLTRASSRKQGFVGKGVHSAASPMNASQLSNPPKASSKSSSNLSLHSQTPSNSIHQDQMIQLHRHHLRECTEIGRLESKLLVSYTMHMNSVGSNEMSFEDYLRSLDDVIEQKLNSVMEMRNYIKKMMNS